MINIDKLLNLIKEDILIGDGAVGTMLQKAGLSTDPDLFTNENINLLPKVEDIHFDYICSGSNIIQTSTFGSNLLKLSAGGYDKKIREINENAADAVFNAVNKYRKQFFETGILEQRPLLIAANIGPTGKMLEPFGSFKFEELKNAFALQADILINTGKVDIVLIETMMDINEAVAAIEGVRSISDDIAIICTLTFNEKGVTLMGNKAEDSVEPLIEAGCTICGANCSVGSDKMLIVVKKIREANPNAKLIFQPNAGLPQMIDGQTVYNETPDEMARNIEKYLIYKPSILGACCGSTPQHIKKIAELVRK